MQVVLIALGCPGVGKSSLLLNFAQDIVPDWPEDHLYGFFVDRTINLLGHEVTVRLRDTEGIDFRNVPSTSVYRGVEGVVFVYDVTNEDTFLDIDNYIDQAAFATAPDVPKILVGNKSDLPRERKITFERGAAFAKLRNFSFYETSVVSGLNVEELFVGLAAEIITKKLCETNIQ